MADSAVAAITGNANDFPTITGAEGIGELGESLYEWNLREM